jgi:hypothetical protein
MIADDLDRNMAAIYGRRALVAFLLKATAPAAQLAVKRRRDAPHVHVTGSGTIAPKKSILCRSRLATVEIDRAAGDPPFEGACHAVS